MFTIFNSKSLWIGFDLVRFHEIRDVLERNGIPYKYKTRNHLGQWSGEGTIRGSKGSFGNATEFTYQYEIFVYNKDIEHAKYCIK